MKLVENDLRASSEAHSLTQVRELMHGITRKAVNSRVREGTLLAIPGPTNRATYPVVQFLPNGSPVEELKEVRDALGTANGWMLLNFLVRPEPKLANKRPISARPSSPESSGRAGCDR